MDAADIHVSGKQRINIYAKMKHRIIVVFGTGSRETRKHQSRGYVVFGQAFVEWGNN